MSRGAFCPRFRGLVGPGPVRPAPWMWPRVGSPWQGMSSGWGLDTGPSTALRRLGGREQRPGEDIHQPQITFPTLKGPVKHGRKLTCQGDRWAAIVAASQGPGSPPPLGSHLHGGAPRLPGAGLPGRGQPWSRSQAGGAVGWLPGHPQVGGARSSPPPPTRPTGQRRPSCPSRQAVKGMETRDGVSRQLEHLLKM